MPYTRVERRRRRRQQLRRRRLGALIAVVLVGALAYGVVTWTTGGAKPGTASGHDRTTTTTTAAGGKGTTTTGGHGGGTTATTAKNGKGAGATTGTFQGPDGVEANWVVAENKLPGTGAWNIVGAPGGITGYASTIQTTVGKTVTLYISTKAHSYTVTAFRMGYYQGLGARQIWQSPTLTGVVQPTCPATSSVHMVECSWTASVQVPITKTFVQGDYLFKLVGTANQQDWIPLTVMDPTSHATYYIQNDVLTWQAWNTFGGYDFYGGNPPGVNPTFTNRARVVSFDRPYAATYGAGAADFSGEELPLIRFMEGQGLDVTYGTDITTGTDPSSLLNHKAFLSLGHDEQWSLTMRNAAQAALAHGVNLAFFGASPVLRKVRTQPSPLGTNREEVNYRTSTSPSDPDLVSDPSQASQNQWSLAPANWNPAQLVGNSYLGFTITVSMTATNTTSWFYAGSGLSNGQTLPHVIRADMNGYTISAPNPPDVQILAHSPAVPRSATGQGHYADTTYYTLTSSKGGVFSSGTNGWIPEMACNPTTSSCPAKALFVLTGNLLKLFGSGPAGDTQPSVANWQQYY